MAVSKSWQPPFLLDFTPKHPKTKLGVFGEIIIENKILKTIQRISHTPTMVLPPVNPLRNQQPHA